MARNYKNYVIDFETRNSEKNIAEQSTSVWLFDICTVDELYSHTNGNSIDKFFNQIYKLSPAIFYSHNLKFDGQFILSYLLSHGFTHTTEKKLLPNEFSTLITDTGVFYSIKVCFLEKNRAKNSHKKKKIAEFRDSTKKINGSVHDIAISYNLPILKGDIDYTAERSEDYNATADEVSYIKNDTEIIARVLSEEFKMGLTKLTTASDTLNLYKASKGFLYDFFFPELDYETDKYIRKSYRGGVVILNDKYKEKINDFPVYVYDINSMYPTQMIKTYLPYGIPEFFKGQYQPDEKYPLFICRIKVCLSIKNGYYPTILMNNMRYCKLEYLKDTNGELIELTLTSTDYYRMLKHYIIYDIEYLDGYKFKASPNLFDRFLLPIYDKKCNSKGSEKQLYKLLLNGLYGKFATNPKHCSKIPYLDENGLVRYKNGEVTIDKTVYTAVSSFITANARDYLYEAIQNNYDSFIYCDTDSVHLTKPIKNAIVDDKKLGAFKLEKTYVKSKYLAQKTYYGITSDGNRELKVAGCPKNVKELITLDNFNFGSRFEGKLLPKVVKGGAVLVPFEFTLKRR